ncbi:hypothetical protein BGW41_006569 [Actinomortierella wolfii]|nr:hypothetical protein BGW41_006569 [Actinomortierella wolfii]
MASLEENLPNENGHCSPTPASDPAVTAAMPSHKVSSPKQEVLKTSVLPNDATNAENSQYPRPYERHDTDSTLVRNDVNAEQEEENSTTDNDDVEDVDNVNAHDDGDGDDDDPPPEGGTRAWLVILGTFLVQTFVFAQTEYIFGVFAENYLRVFPGSSASQITLVGTIGSGVTYLAGIGAGILSDRIGYRITSLTGTVVMTLALIFASLAKEVWHLYLSQGVLFGIGASLSYYPAMGAPSHWFEKRRGFVMGIQGCGTGIGGFVLAPVAQALLDRVGLNWTNRFFAGYCFVICGIASFMIVERKRKSPGKKIPTKLKRSPSSVTEVTAAATSDNLDKKQEKPIGLHDISIKKIMKQPAFHMLLLSQMVISLVYLLPMYFMQTYSVHIGLTPQQGATIIAFFNGSTCIGRLGLGYLGDRYSKDKALLFSVYLLAISVLGVWTFAKSFASLVSFGVLYGIAFAGMITLTPTKIADIYGPHRMASVLGVAWSVACPSMFLGTFAGSKILELSAPDTTYIPMILFTGAGFILSALLYTLWLLLALRQKRRIQAAILNSKASAL